MMKLVLVCVLLCKLVTLAVSGFHITWEENGIQRTAQLPVNWRNQLTDIAAMPDALDFTDR